MSLIRRYSRKKAKSSALSLIETIKGTNKAFSRTPIKRCQMTNAELKNIIDTVKKEKLSHKEAAIKFGITKSLVQRLMSKHSKDKKSLIKAERKEHDRRLKLRAVLNESKEILESKEGLIAAK